MLTVNAEAKDLIRRNEGCRLTAYLDSVGILTIGYGHTEGVHPYDRITQQQAEELFESDVQRFANKVEKLLGSAHVTSNQFGAMVSLAYNIGLGHFAASSVLRMHLKKLPKAAANAFLLWDRAGGQVLEGLERRRQEERALYLKEDHNGASKD